MDKLDTLNYSYDTLLKAGRIRNKKDFAALLGRDYAGVVAAMGGNPKFLTDSLVSQAVAAVNNVPEGETPPLRVPMIPVEAHAGSLTEFADAVNEYDCEMVVSPVRGAAFAIQVTGDSMAPAYPSGAKILCQRVDETAFVEWGRVYLLDTVNGAILKQVRKSDNPGCVTCCSLNTSPEYAPFDVETRHIIAWYRVLMIMSLV